MSNELERHTFWMVWHEDGNSPTYRHASKSLAIAEAERLAGRCPGEVFFVLKTVAGVIAKAPEIERVKITIDPIPF